MRGIVAMLVSATAIQTEMAALRDGDPWQLECMRLCTVAIDLFTAAAAVTILPRNDDGRAERELVALQIIGIRVLNSMGATDELILQGFFQSAAIMIRDTVECSYLLDLFSRAREHLPKWIALGQEAGMKEYMPGQVRDLLNAIDGIDRKARQAPYTFYSRYGTHPNSEAVGLIAPEAAVHIGPFVDETRLIGLTYDLTRFGVLAAMHLSRSMIAIDLVENQAYRALGEACISIEKAFMALNEHLNAVPTERLRAVTAGVDGAAGGRECGGTMKIAMRSADAIRRARELYDGASLPISVLKEGRDALQIDWWTSSPRPERADSERQQAGLRLYLEIGARSRPELDETAFPALMDLEDSAMRPDKGIVKALIDGGLISSDLVGAQLIFSVTEKGQGFLAQVMPSPMAGPNRTP